ncbi:hypothetical protein R4Z09_21055 [Niallia oryzisoli]|uniref:Uncharacterized protein n=1 Tax=Niallia oryzisoli TaxID=1737571 RepID=A0ABZ2C840_9BACI
MIYTYNSFESLGVFTLHRSIFITILIFSILLFFTIIIPRFQNNMINGFTVLTHTVVSILVSGQLLYFDGIVVDEIGLGGDPVSFILFLAIAGIGIINLIVYFSVKGKSDYKS